MVREKKKHAQYFLILSLICLAQFSSFGVLGQSAVQSKREHISSAHLDSSDPIVAHPGETIHLGLFTPKNAPFKHKSYVDLWSPDSEYLKYYEEDIKINSDKEAWDVSLVISEEAPESEFKLVVGIKYNNEKILQDGAHETFLIKIHPKPSAGKGGSDVVSCQDISFNHLGKNFSLPTKEIYAGNIDVSRVNGKYAGYLFKGINSLRIKNDFCLLDKEVSISLFNLFKGSTNHSLSSNDNSVSKISWKVANDYVQWIDEKIEGYRVSLPSINDMRAAFFQNREDRHFIYYIASSYSEWTKDRYIVGNRNISNSYYYTFGLHKKFNEKENSDRFILPRNKSLESDVVSFRLKFEKNTP